MSRHFDSGVGHAGAPTEVGPPHSTPFAEQPMEHGPHIPVLKPGVELASSYLEQPKLGPVAVKIFEKAAPAVVQIVTDQGLGSGYFADKEGHVVTNAHVVVGASEVSVIAADGTRYKAQIDKLNDVEDLASLKISGFDPSKQVFLENSKTPVTADQPVYALGHPLGNGATYFSPGYARGQLFYSQMLDDKQILPGLGRPLNALTPAELPDARAALKRPLLQACVHIKPGNSGGPLIDQSGKVVGVNDLANPKDSENSYFIPSAKVTEFLARESKFRFTYRNGPEKWVAAYEHQWHETPLLAFSETAIAGSLGCLGYRSLVRSPRSASLGVGFYGAGSLITDGKSFLNSSDSDDKWKYGLACVSDLAMVAGTVAVWVPRARTLAMVALAGGLFGHVGTDFIPNHLILSDVSRRDGTLRPPQKFY